MAAFGGDEVSALVLDMGTQWTKAGYAGEDTPKAVVPSDAGYLQSVADLDARAMDVDGSKHPDQKQWFLGDNAISHRRDNMEIINPMKDGLINNWEAAEQVWSYAFNKSLRVRLQEHPLLIAEPSFNNRENREKMAQVFFEQHQVPALFLCKNAVLTAYSCGKSTAIVIDSGAGTTSVTPVYDGYVLKNNIIKQNLAGDALTQIALHMLEDQYKVKVIPSFLVAEKKVIESGRASSSKLRELGKTSSSFYNFSKFRVAAEFKEMVAAVSAPVPLEDNEDKINLLGKRSYEFPDGFNMLFGSERYRIGEALFNPIKYYPYASKAPGEVPMGLHEMVSNTLKLCDSELWAPLLQATIVTGGTTLMNGLTDRLTSQVTQIATTLKVKVITPSNSVERRFSSWVGGSILGSLGSFHQMWISKSEYDEIGPTVIEQKCP